MAFLKRYMSLGHSVNIPSEQSVPTQPDLAITPAVMAEMVDSGIPVSSQSISGVFDDGVPNPSWDIPIDLKRGVDVAEVWQAQRDARSHVVNGVQPIKSDVQPIKSD